MKCVTAMRCRWLTSREKRPHRLYWPVCRYHPVRPMHNSRREQTDHFTLLRSTRSIASTTMRRRLKKFFHGRRKMCRSRMRWQLSARERLLCVRKRRSYLQSEMTCRHRVWYWNSLRWQQMTAMTFCCVNVFKPTMTVTSKYKLYWKTMLCAVKHANKRCSR